MLRGYLAHKKQPPLGPYSRDMPRPLWWSQGGGAALRREGPFEKQHTCLFRVRCRPGRRGVPVTVPALFCED